MSESGVTIYDLYSPTFINWQDIRTIYTTTYKGMYQELNFNYHNGKISTLIIRGTILIIDTDDETSLKIKPDDVYGLVKDYHKTKK